MAASLQVDDQLSWVSDARAIPNQTHAVPKPRSWLISERADFWFASAGASGGLLAALAVIALYGDRELDWLDLVFSELHLGATYGAIMRRRLWRRFPTDVLVVPLIILVLTYALTMRGHAILLTSITMYAAVWHRGRQSLGVARFYQRAMGGSVSRAHAFLFRGAIYLPMLAGMLAYMHLAPVEYEGKPYLALSCGGEIASIVGLAATSWVIAYLAWTLCRNHIQRVISAPQNLESSDFDVKQGSKIAPRRRGGRRVNQFLTKKFSELCELCTTLLENLRGLGKFSNIRNISDSDISPAKAPRTLSSDKYFLFFFVAFASLREIIRNSVAASPRWASVVNTFSQETRNNQTVGGVVHPGEWWVVLAHAIAFGSGYALGASNASFLLVLAVHHEVQYLYFTYAMARHPGHFYAMSKTGTDPAMKDLDSKASYKDRSALRTEARHATSFLVWPVIGFVGAMVGPWTQLQWLAPLGIGGLFCHYWLDSRIWTRRATGIT
jgi:hypothetical protein